MGAELATENAKPTGKITEQVSKIVFVWFFYGYANPTNIRLWLYGNTPLRRKTGAKVVG